MTNRSEQLRALRKTCREVRTKRHLEQPLYYSGKWWARRLAVASSWMVQEAVNGTPSAVVLDPFAGSGTTLGEALRLGHRTIGVDINPFAAALMRTTFGSEAKELESVYLRIVSKALDDVSVFYSGRSNVAGWFWGYETDCPRCGHASLLTKRPVLAMHAYPRRHPQGWVFCPHSRHVFKVRDVSAKTAGCPCGRRIRIGKASPGRFQCTNCAGILSPGGANNDDRPRSVLLAVEQRFDNGKRAFSRPTSRDKRSARLAETRRVTLPPAPIAGGRTAEQILRWGYTDWSDLLHPRQALLAKALTKRIARVSSYALRSQLAMAFSPFFEYHCRLTSFKGLGTGAVRQAFGRPVLHPVAISYEVNPLATVSGKGVSGDPKSWYALRTKRSSDALQQLEASRGARVQPGSTASVLKGNADVAIVCNDSSSLNLPRNSVDAIVTDPPYFDRVQYDDLAGPFNAWLSWCGCRKRGAARGAQSSDAHEFSRRIHGAFKASLCALKRGGIVSFTFHHNDLDAWVALANGLESLLLSGISYVLVPSEMPNALIKHRAHEPVTHDAILILSKQARRGSSRGSVRRAHDLALRQMEQAPSALTGDVSNAALAAALIVGLQLRDGVSDWAAFMGDVLERVGE